MPKPNGPLIRKLRTDRGESQVELAVRAGVSLATVGLIEGGKNLSPQKSTLRAIAMALGKTLDEVTVTDSTKVTEQAS